MRPTSALLLLVACGAPIEPSPAEVYDPATGAWTATGSMSGARHLHAAVLLPTGQVLIAGGIHGSSGVDVARTSAELYEPDTGAFAPTGSMQTPRAGPALLPYAGEVLANGALITRVRNGAGFFHVIDTAERFHPPPL